MMITQLKVRNYKSLKELDLPLKTLNIFVGPNNAGKSNIFEVLLLLSELVNIGGSVIHSRGGFSDIVWNGELQRTISITLEGEERKQRFRYEIELAGGPEHFSCIKEQFTVNIDKEPLRLMELVVERGGSRSVLYNEQLEQISSGPSLSAGSPSALRTLTSVVPSGLVGEFAKSVSEWTRHILVGGQMRTPQGARRDLKLQSTGQNLSNVLHTLQTEYPQQFQRIKELLKTVVPELQDLYTPLTEQGQTLVNMNEEGLSKSIPLWALANGTLHTLGIFTALYSPALPPLMCFEEPENYVHPRVLVTLAEAFREASQRSQILISTHSPYFLDCFKPEDVVIIEKVRGCTQARRVSGHKGVKEALKVLGLGELWYSGELGGVPR